MAVDERSRHNLHVRLEQVLGETEAETFMEMMPPVGWADVATKRDLDNLAVATKRDIDNLAVAVDLKLDSLENKLLAAFRVETRTWVFSMMAFFTALSGVFLAVFKLG